METQEELQSLGQIYLSDILKINLWKALKMKWCRDRINSYYQVLGKNGLTDELVLGL